MNTTVGFNIIDIPWERFPGMSSDLETKAYVKMQQLLYTKYSIVAIGVPFKEDIWELDVSNRSTKYRKVRLVFSDIPNRGKDIVKFYTLKIMPLYKPETTLSTYLSSIKEVLRKANDLFFHDDLLLVTNKDIQTVIKSETKSPARKCQQYRALIPFFIYVKEVCGLDCPVNIDELKKEKDKELKRLLSSKNAHKIKNIPKRYYQAILTKAIEVMRDKDEPTVHRETACMIVIQSQTGLRPDSLLSLEIDKLVEKRLKNGRIVYALTYRNEKERKASQPTVFDMVPLNEYALEAYHTALELRKCIPESSKTKALYVLPSYKPASKEGAYTLQSRYKSAFIRFLDRYLHDESSQQWQGLRYSKCDELGGKRIAFPDLRQFRVNYATIADEKGASPEAVRQALGHRSETMKGYYNRPEDTYEEDMARKKEAMMAILDENVDLIGVRGADLKTRIKDFIEKNKANVDTGPEAILRKLDGTIGIRTKRFGYCISDPLFPCNKDTQINELMCVLDLCPNTYYIYHDLDRTLFQFDLFKQSSQMNYDLRRTSEAWKELHTMQQFLTRVVIPQINSLEKCIEKEGEEEVKRKHTNLNSIIDNIQSIKEDVTIWKNKKELTYTKK